MSAAAQLILAGQVLAALLLALHGRYFHRPGTAHAAWWASRPPGLRRLAGPALISYWLAVTGLLYLLPALALALTWAWVLGYGALLIARRGSAAVVLPRFAGTPASPPAEPVASARPITPRSDHAEADRRGARHLAGDPGRARPRVPGRVLAGVGRRLLHPRHRAVGHADAAARRLARGPRP